MGHNDEGSYRVGIPRIGVRDITFYEGSVLALAMVGSKLVTVDMTFSCSAHQPFSRNS